MSAIDLGLPVHARPPARSSAPDPARHLRLTGQADGSVGSVHSWELVTAVDGPGTRLTIFLSGCPLRCQYCQNPDTWRKHDGTATSAEELLDRVRHYRPVFEATGGGVTISGGEPLLQAAFVERVFTGCAALGVHTALDTSGYLGAKASDALLDATGLVLLDVKSGIPSTYRLVTGRELAPTVAFGDRLAARGIPMWIRYVLVPGLTDAAENVEAVADIVARWGVERLEVLPFHQFGDSKWDRLGIPYPLRGVRPPDDALVDRVRAQFCARGITTF